ncbi:MAG: tetratricopeptide repeat protein, partial [bacterium]
IRDAVVYWIAEVHFKGNSYNKAAAFYKVIIDEFTQSVYCVYAYYSFGWCLFQEGKFQEAMKYFKIVEDKFPMEQQAQDASFKILECLYNLKDYAALLEKIKPYLKTYSKDPLKTNYLYFYMAEAEYYLNNFNEAIEGYSKVIANSNDDRMKTLSKLGIGWSYLKSKQYKEAQDVFEGVNLAALEKKNQDALLLAQAILAFETKKFSEAKDIYSDLINKASGQDALFQAYLGKADTLYNIAEYKEAIGVYREGLEKASVGNAPQDIVDKLYYGLAWAFLKEGKFKEAIAEFQKIAKQTEDKTIKVAALCQIGDAYQDAGDYAKSQETYDSILKDYPDSFYSDYVQYQLGLVLLKASNYDAAILAFGNLHNNFPDSKLSDDAYYALGLSYFQREDYKSSKEIFNKFQIERKDSYLRPQAVYLLGTSLYNLGNFTEAIEVFKDIIRTYSQDTELMQKAEYEIADCYDQMGNEKEAMSRFKTLRSKYPDSRLTPEIVWWLGEYYYRHSDLAMARRYFLALIQDFPKSNLITDAYYVMGSIYSEENQYEQAISSFKKVMEFAKSDLTGQAAVAIADIYVKQDKEDLALSTYKEVVEGYPNLGHLIYPKAADIYYKKRDYGQALGFYRKSLEVVPLRQMSDIQFKIGELLETQGKLQDAIEEYLKVTYLYSENNDLAVKALLRVASIYEDKNNLTEAVNIYRRVISMDVKEAKYAKERIDWLNNHKGK